MEKTYLQILQEARALIAAGWCQGPFHTVTDTGDCYCACGAIERSFGVALDHLGGHPKPEGYWLLRDLLETLAEERGFSGIIWFNEAEGRTKEEVLALYDEAIARFDEALEMVTK